MMFSLEIKAREENIRIQSLSTRITILALNIASARRRI
jgi:hypothetical protein